jgi:hypothetical protein
MVSEEIRHRWTLLGFLLIVCVSLSSRPASAQQEDNACIGWAIGGSLGGGMIAGWTTVGVYGLADVDINDKDHQTRTGLVLGSAITVGVLGGGMLGCHLLGDDPNTIPAATFVTAGGMAGFGSTLALFYGLWPKRSEGGMVIGSTLMVIGGGLGAWGGYALHRARLDDDSSDTIAMFLPWVDGNRFGLSFSARY